MLGGVRRAWDNLLGAGDAAVTVPPLDGALRPNRRLDEAEWRLPLTEVDALAVVSDRLVASAARTIVALDGDRWTPWGDYEAEIACIAVLGEDALAVALATGEIIGSGGAWDGRRYRAAPDARCITAMASAGNALYVANGSASHAPDDWQRDLLERRSSGSIWRIDLDSGASTRIARGLAWPAGLAIAGEALVVSEAWKHRLVRIDASGAGHQRALYTDMPGYPGRIAPAAGGYWLAVFAPRSQLVEFVLREPGYARRMVREVPRPYWIAPKLRAGRSFYEPLQGGGVKHLGVLKPWAPALSAGMCVALDSAFQPRASLHSRADGTAHGVTSITEHRGRIFVAARGDGVVVSIPVESFGDRQ
jgi:hypothetical protein